MLFISGEINGEIKDRSKVTTEEILELFDIKDYFSFVNKNNQDAMVHFEYHKSATKMKNGILRHPNRYRVPCEMKAIYKGRSITITYAEREQFDSNGNHTTFPDKVNFGGRSKRSFRWHQNMELIIWMALHPSNASSPLRTERTTKKIVWDVINEKDRSNKRFEDFQADAAIRMEILKDNPKVLSRKARGLGIVLSDKTPENRIREMLMSQYEKAIASGKREIFIEKFHSAEVGVSGMIQQLVDMKYIIQRKNSTGQTYFAWRAGLPVSGNIVVCQKGVVPIEHLKRTMLTNFALYDKHIRAIMEGIDINNDGLQRFDDDMNAESRNNAPKKVSEMDDYEVVSELKLNDLVGYNHSTKGVHFYNQKKYGEFLKDTLLKIEIPKEWMSELAAAMDSNIDLKVTLKEKLSKFKNQ